MPKQRSLGEHHKWVIGFILLLATITSVTWAESENLLPPPQSPEPTAFNKIRQSINKPTSKSNVPIRPSVKNGITWTFHVPSSPRKVSPNPSPLKPTASRPVPPRALSKAQTSEDKLTEALKKYLPSNDTTVSADSMVLPFKLSPVNESQAQPPLASPPLTLLSGKTPDTPDSPSLKSLSEWLGQQPEAKKIIPEQGPRWTWAPDTQQWDDLPEAKPDLVFPVADTPTLRDIPPIAALSIESSEDNEDNNPEGKVVEKKTAAKSGDDDDAELTFDEIIHFEDDNAKKAKRPRFSVDYGTYSMKMRALDEYRLRIHQAMKLAKAIDFGVSRREMDDLVYEADSLKSDFQTAYFNSRSWEDAEAADKIYNQASVKMLQAMVMTTPSPRVEGRAIWLDRGSIVKAENEEGMRALMQRLSNAGVNIVYYEAINAGYSLYPSQQMVENPDIKAQDWDPLKVAVEEGHKLGMEVHAWVWCFAVGNQRHNVLLEQPKSYPGPVLKEKGLMSEALRMGNGSIMPPRQTEYWLSPASPKARKFLVNAFDELVTQYPLDGLHLDYIRYPFQRIKSQAGYEPISRQRFLADTGHSLGNGGSYRLWMAWKTQQVNSFVHQVSDLLKSKKRHLTLSAAVFPMSRMHRISAIQQDWETWVNHGWVDAINPMNYARSKGRYKRTLGNVLHYANDKALVYSGLAIDRVNEAQMLDQIWASRELGAQGTTLFANVHLNDAKAFVLKDGAYKVRPAIPPHRNPQMAFQVMFGDLKPRMNKALEKIGYAEAPALSLLNASPKTKRLVANADAPANETLALQATATNVTQPTSTGSNTESIDNTSAAASVKSDSSNPETLVTPVTVESPRINESNIHQSIRSALLELEAMVQPNALSNATHDTAVKSPELLQSAVHKNPSGATPIPVSETLGAPDLSASKLHAPLNRLITAFDQWQALHRKSNPLLTQYFTAQLHQLRQLANYWQRQQTHSGS